MLIAAFPVDKVADSQFAIGNATALNRTDSGDNALVEKRFVIDPKVVGREFYLTFLTFRPGKKDNVKLLHVNINECTAVDEKNANLTVSFDGAKRKDYRFLSRVVAGTVLGIVVAVALIAFAINKVRLHRRWKQQTTKKTPCTVKFSSTSECSVYL